MTCVTMTQGGGRSLCQDQAEFIKTIGERKDVACLESIDLDSFQI
jgi:hypothetical protein